MFRCVQAAVSAIAKKFPVPIRTFFWTLATIKGLAPNLKAADDAGTEATDFVVPCLINEDSHYPESHQNPARIPLPSLWTEK